MLLCAEGFTTEHLMAWQAHETVCDVVSNRGLTTEHLMAGAGHGAGVRQDVSGNNKTLSLQWQVNSAVRSPGQVSAEGLTGLIAAWCSMQLTLS